MYAGNVTFSDGDSDNMVTSALFGRPMQETQAYAMSRVNEYVSRLADGAVAFKDSVVERFNQYNNASFLHRVENLRSKLNQAWQVDAIRMLSVLQDIQNATPVMQRWVMANPTLRTIYNRGGAVGYEGEYVDNYPGVVGKDHYDYRRVMHGIVQGDVEGAPYTQYYESTIAEGDILSIIDATAILRTWKHIDSHIEESNVDPTSNMNDLLG